MEGYILGIEEVNPLTLRVKMIYPLTILVWGLEGIFSFGEVANGISSIGFFNDGTKMVTVSISSLEGKSEEFDLLPGPPHWITMLPIKAVNDILITTIGESGERQLIHRFILKVELP